MGNFTAVPDVVVNQSFPPSLWESAIMNNLNLGVFRQLDEAILLAPAASVTFASIPQTFAHLIVVVYARTAVASTGDTLTAQFNGDTTTNYDTYELIGGGGAAAATSAKVGVVSGNNAPANAFGGVWMLIPHYTQTANQKLFLALSAAKESNTAPVAAGEVRSGFWRSNTAITQILLQAAGNLQTGSRMTLYGLPA